MQAAAKVAEFVSLPYEQYARLILKVSHNLGANLSLDAVRHDRGRAHPDTALAAERKALTEKFGIPDDGFNFPTNGSGSPDSQASPAAVTALLQAMSKTPVGGDVFDALPISASTVRSPPSAASRPTR